MKCPHMTGDQMCSICRELVAYKICFEGGVEAMKESKDPLLRAASKTLMLTFKAVHKACMEEPFNVQEIAGSFESIAGSGESDDDGGPAVDAAGG